MPGRRQGRTSGRLQTASWLASIGSVRPHCDAAPKKNEKGSGLVGEVQNGMLRADIDANFRSRPPPDGARIVEDLDPVLPKRERVNGPPPRHATHWLIIDQEVEAGSESRVGSVEARLKHQRRYRRSCRWAHGIEGDLVAPVALLQPVLQSTLPAGRHVGPMSHGLQPSASGTANGPSSPADRQTSHRRSEDYGSTPVTIDNCSSISCKRCRSAGVESLRKYRNTVSASKLIR